MISKHYRVVSCMSYLDNFRDDITDMSFEDIKETCIWLGCPILCSFEIQGG